jgi:murein biosynthesis integral membrane protein MurJ
MGEASGDPGGLRSFAAASSVISGLTLLSRLTGFARGVVIAAVLGPTFFGNLFIVTNSLPNLLYEFAIGSLLVSLLVPPLVQHLDRGDLERARRTANGTLGVLCLLFFGVSMLIVLAGPLVLRVLGAGIDDPAVIADQRRVGWLLLALLVPQAVLYAVVGTSAAIQNAHGKYFLTAAAPVAENVGTIVVFLTFAARWGTGVDLHDATVTQILFLGLGATAAVGMHAGVQWWGAWKLGHALVPTAGWRDPDVRDLLRLGLRSLGYATANSGRYLVALVAAGAVPGGVVAYQLALNFRDLPNALVSKPLSVTSLPTLSRHAQGKRWNDFAALYRSTVRLSVFLQTLTTVLLVVLAVPIVHTVAFGGMDSSIGRTLLLAALATMALGIAGDGAFLLATNTCYARRDATGPFHVMLVRTVLTAAGALLALRLDGTATLVGLGLSIAFADIAAGLLLHRRLESRLHTDARGVLLRPILAIVGAGAASAAAGSVVTRFVHPGDDAPRIAHLATAALGAAVVVAVYVLTARALRLAEVDDLRQFVPGLRRGAGRSAPSTAPDAAAAATNRGAAAVSPASARMSARPLIVAAVVASAAVAGAVVIGLAAALAGVLVIAAVAGVIVIVAVAARPALAAYLWLGTVPLIVGIDRGVVVPLLRLNEALLALLLVGLLVRALVAPRGRCRFTTLDAAVTAVAVCGSVVPLLVVFSRTHTVSFDEVTYAAPLVKLALTYCVFRVAVRKPAEVRTALMIGITAACVAALIGFAQSIGVGPVRSLLTSGLYAGGVDAATAIASGRGTSTLGTAIGAAGLYVGYLLVCAAWFTRPGAPRRFLLVALGALTVGAAGTAQFTAVIGLIAAFAAVAYLRARNRKEAGLPPWHFPSGAGVRMVALVAVAGGLVAGWFALGSRVAVLLAGDVPQSWTARWYNLSTHFLSELGLNTNLLIGVSPVTQVRDPRGFVEWIWIESGYVQLVYTGGLALLGAFGWMMAVHLRSAWANRRRADEFGACSVAAWAMGLVVCLLMLLDPHLTIRGTSDLFFPLLAMSATAAALAPAGLLHRGDRATSSPRPGVGV